MTLRLNRAVLLVYEHENEGGGAGTSFETARDEADYVIPGDESDQWELTQKATDRVDTATLTLDNYGGDHTGDLQKNQRVALYTHTSDPIDKARRDAAKRPAAEYDAGSYGASVYDDYTEPLYAQNPVHRWTGLIDTHTNTHNGGLSYTLEVDAGDYVFSTLKNRRYSYSYEDTPISGTPGAILNRALIAEAPEIDRHRIDSVGVTTDLTWRRRTLLDLLKRCVSRGNAVARADDTALVFTPTDALEPKFEITHESGDWYGGMSVSYPVDSFYNRLFLVGGTEPLEDDAQRTTDTTIPLSAGSSGRIQIPITPDSDYIDSASVWTDPPTDSEGNPTGDGVVARIQRDVGGAPIAPSDKQSDIASGQIDAEDLTVSGWTRINISDGVVSRDNAWLILQTQSGGTLQIGAQSNSDGTTSPAFTTYRPYDTAVQRENSSSVAEYGRVDDALAEDTLETANETGDRAESLVESAAQIPTVISGVEARSERMHSLRPADVVTIDAPLLTPTTGAFVVTDRKTTFSGPEMTTELTFRDLETL